MNIKNKANLHFKLFPVIYEENQYACTISAAKSYIGKYVRLKNWNGTLPLQNVKLADSENINENSSEYS